MNSIIAIIGGLGIGSLLTSVVTHFITRRAASSDRWYQEKREAYLGLIAAIHAAAVKPSDEGSKAYALWQTRCDLFGSPMVAGFAQRFVDTQGGPQAEREQAFRGLIEAMRADLKKQISG